MAAFARRLAPRTPVAARLAPDQMSESKGRELERYEEEEEEVDEEEVDDEDDNEEDDDEGGEEDEAEDADQTPVWSAAIQDLRTEQREQRKRHNELDPKRMANDVFEGDNFDAWLENLASLTRAAPSARDTLQGAALHDEEDRNLANPEWGGNTRLARVEDWEVEGATGLDFLSRDKILSLFTGNDLVRHYLFLGPSTYGKSTCALHLLRILAPYFEFFMCFAPTDTSYDALRSFLPAACIHKRAPLEEDIVRIMDFMRSQTSGGRKDTSAPRMLLFMDDCSSDEKGAMRGKVISNLYSIGRQYNISIWVTAQMLEQLQGSVVSQSHRVICTANAGDDREKIFKNFFSVMPKSHFLGETKQKAGKRVKTPSFFDIATGDYRCLCRLNKSNCPLKERVYLLKFPRRLHPSQRIDGVEFEQLPYDLRERYGASMWWHVSNAIANVLAPLNNLSESRKKTEEGRMMLFSRRHGAEEAEAPAAKSSKRTRKPKKAPSAS